MTAVRGETEEQWAILCCRLSISKVNLEYNAKIILTGVFQHDKRLFNTLHQAFSLLLWVQFFSPSLLHWNNRLGLISQGRDAN